MITIQISSDTYQFSSLLDSQHDNPGVSCVPCAVIHAQPSFRIGYN